MKKIFVIFAFVLVSCTIHAQGPVIKHTSPDSIPKYQTWSIFQLGLFPGVPGATADSRVIGIKTGWPICTGLGVVDGFESSWILSGTQWVNGLQASLFMNFSKHMIGFQPALAMNIASRTVQGFQASCLFNLAGEVTGVQAGGLNIARSLTGFQPGVLGNFTRTLDGCQAGLFNISEETNGVQVSPTFNLTKETKSWCFQAGLVNVNAGKKGIQFGLINVIKDGWVPFLPFFNISL